MCGRYRLSQRKQIIWEHFDCGSDEPDWAPRYSIAPTQPVPVIRHEVGTHSNCFEINEGALFAFAGIWDRWKDPSGNWVRTCSILTTTPNAATSAVHDRMPVILDPESYDLWLDPGMGEVNAPSDLLKPFDARLLRCYPVSSRVNSAVDDAACSAPVELAEAQARLFL
jgi:putative SOS response-associated peptidase YedK